LILLSGKNENITITKSHENITITKSHENITITKSPHIIYSTGFIHSTANLQQQDNINL